MLGVPRAAPRRAAVSAARGDGALPIDPVRGWWTRLTNEVVVVVRTKAGAASTVARAIDEPAARRPGDGRR